MRQRIKHTTNVARQYEQLTAIGNLKNSELTAQLKASRYATRWYRERWIFTMIALIVVVLAVAGGLLVG